MLFRSVAFSSDGGQSFDHPIRIDQGNPLGRVAIVALPEGGAIVVWLEIKETQTLIQYCRINKNHQPGKTQTISKTSRSRASGFPQIVVKGKQAFIAWTQIKESPNKSSQKTVKKQINTVILPIKQSK